MRPLITKRGENTYICLLDSQLSARMMSDLPSRGYKMKEEIPHALFGATKDSVSLTMFKNGKLLIQGKEARAFIQFYLEPYILRTVTLGYEEVLDESLGIERIGVDESGKGDYFGPLVVAAAYVDRPSVRKLLDIGVCDSKVLSDGRVLDIGEKLREFIKNSVVVIGPEKYNELYAKIGNLNRILAWGHARAIENLLSEVDCSFAVLDKFADESLVNSSLMRKGRKITVEQRVRGEQDLAVAAASIIARAEFLRRLERLSRLLGIKLQKGGSSKGVEEAAGKIVKNHGLEALSRVAKLHFKTTKRVILASPDEENNRSVKDNGKLQRKI